ncbi:MAG: ABC transporter permease, partial [Nitriliruptorales bacterium]
MSAFVGTGALTRLALRLDRVRLAVWILSLVAVTLVFGAAIGDLYPTVAARRQLELSIAANPALTAVLGPAFDLATVGGLVAWRMGFLPLVLVPLMALLAVVRHTRAEEETGRQELVGSTVVGRRAPLTAALLVAAAASLAIGVLVAVGLVVMGEAVGGSVALGGSYVAAGWMFAAVAAVAAQITESARAAGGIAGTVLGLSYLVRGVGDAAGEGGLSALSWVSPLGWVLHVRAFAGERWWVLGLALALVAVLVAAAYGLVARRDLGAGLLPARLGP